MSQHKVKKQVLIPLTLTFVILISSFLYTSYRIRMDEYASGLDSRYLRVQSIFASLMEERIRSMTTVVEFIADQRRFQNAMREQDRELLLQHGNALYERLYRQQQITHFYFYDAEGRIFLRVYQPENILESVARHTKQQAMDQGQPSAGLELGGAGTFTLRMVFPWHVDGELLGYIELGQEIDHLLQELKEITSIDFLVALNKAYLERSAWEDGMRMLGREPLWNLIADKVLIDQTVPIPPLLAAELLRGHRVYERYGATIDVNGRTFRARSFPLQDAARRGVGDFVMLKDMTEEVAAFRAFISQIVAFSLLLSATLFVFAYRVLGRVDRRLVESRQRLQQEFERQAEINRRLETEVAERRKAEQSLIELNENLEQRVQERTQKLNSLNREIEGSRRELETAYKNLQAQQATILQQDKMACIGQLAAGIAHDINNPIGFVAGNLEVVEQLWEKVGEYLRAQEQALAICAPADIRAHMTQTRDRLQVDYALQEFPAVVAECIEGTERVNRIVLNLKGFSRIDETGARLADIHECLESTLGIVGNELRYKADITKDYGDIPEILCYPQQLNQVFMNLLINAAQAIERWGEISIRTWTAEGRIHIAIGDTGGGIPKENLARVFEPFFTTKEVGVGTGLGLSIVYDIIKKHRGDIAVESEVNKGSVFTIRLPLDGLEPTGG